MILSGRIPWIEGFNDLATTHPELTKEWDYEKNGKLTPLNVVEFSNKKIWWLCDKGHSWDAPICRRTQKESGCPYCSGRLPIKGETDLETFFPEIARDWNYQKNGNLLPSDVAPGSHLKVWWLCPLGHEWEAVVGNRTGHNKTGCPICSNISVLAGYNDLATTHPALAKEWNYDKNYPLKPSDIMAGCNKKVWWICSLGHEWKAVVNSRRIGCGCPKCARMGQQKKVINMDTNTIYSSVKEASESLGISDSGISLCCKGKLNTSGGYHWKYVE